MYDTKNDPYELHDLATDPKHSGKLSELRNELDTWMKNMKDKGFIPEKQWIESMWPGGVQPSTAEPVFSSSANKVSINCSTEGNSISWQLVPKGQKPAENKWQIYTGLVTLGAGQQLFAMAERIGYKASAVKGFGVN
jgi:hypothetical protein